MKTSDYYYNIDSIISKFKLPREGTIDIMTNDNNDMLLHNVLYYGDRYYINIKAMLYISYVYSPYSKAYDVFLNIINHIDNLDIFTKSILDISNDYLIFNNKEVASYVYVVTVGGIVKIGCTINPIKRFKSIHYNSHFINKNDKLKLQYLLKLPSSIEGFKHEREIHRKFAKLNIDSEYFTANDEIDKIIVRDYTKILV